jgi:hypothetical protein
VLGRSRAPCLLSGCLTTIPPAICRFLDSPRRTGRATFTASGSPESGIPRQGLLPGLSPVRRSPVSPHFRGHLVSCLAGRHSPGALRPVAGFPDLRLLWHLRRFPGFSPRLLRTSVSGKPPTFTLMDSTRRFRRRLTQSTTHPLSGVPDQRRGNSGLPVAPFLRRMNTTPHRASCGNADRPQPLVTAHARLAPALTRTRVSVRNYAPT